MRTLVMAGLVPAPHAVALRRPMIRWQSGFGAAAEDHAVRFRVKWDRLATRHDVGGRDKPGHDEMIGLGAIVPNVNEDRRKQSRLLEAGVTP